MVVLLGFILGLSFAALGMWVILQSGDVAPIMAGQEWHVDGIGRVKIVDVMGSGKSYKGHGSNINVKYEAQCGMIGYCSKHEIRKTGKLLQPATLGLKQKKDEKIDIVLEWADYKKKHGIPKPKSKSYVDAELVKNDITLYCKKGRYRKL